MKAGNDFEDLKNISMDICYEGLSPHDPDILCEGLVNNYAPHVSIHQALMEYEFGFVVLI